MHNSNLFSQFTNKYSLSKTLRFELVPVGNTKKLLEDDKVFTKDELIQEKYRATKSFFDKLHRDFVNEALNNISLPLLSDYHEVFKKWKMDKKTHEKSLQNIEIKLRQELIFIFNDQAKRWADKYSNLAIKKKDIELLFEESVFSILKARYGQEEGSEIIDKSTGKLVSIFDSWKGFTGYFIKFQETRRNFYKSDGTASAIATRIIDQNLKRFCDNIQIYENLKDKIDFSEANIAKSVSLSDVFSINYYNKCLLQEGLDNYNGLLGGATLANGEKQKGLNEIINLYRQKTKEKISFFKALDKQILSEKIKLITEIESDEAFFETLKTFSEKADSKAEILKLLFDDFLNNQDRYSLHDIYISHEALNTISHKWTNETELFEERLHVSLRNAGIVSGSVKKYDGMYSFPDFIALSFVKKALEFIPTDYRFWKDRYYKDSELKTIYSCVSLNEPVWDQFLQIFNVEFSSLFKRSESDPQLGDIRNIGFYYYKQELLNVFQNRKIDQGAKIVIKNYADETLRIYQMAKYFAIEKKRKWLEEYDTGDFYENPEFGYKKYYENAYEDIVQAYNKIRNYLTKKPYSKTKWKLNFENSSLLNGWPDSPEGNTQYCSFIFRNRAQYFLGITDCEKLYDGNKYPEAYVVDNKEYEKLVYKQVDAKTLYGSVYRGLFKSKYSDDVKILTNEELMQRIKKVIESRMKYFPELKIIFDDINHKKYKDAKSLARALSDCAFYNISFIPVSESYLKQGIYSIKSRNGNFIKKKHYLFKIWNKDWNEGAKGSKNLHTLYFESLFSADNIAANFPVKLNGQAELFYRPKTENLKRERIITKSNKVELVKGEKAYRKNRYTVDKIFFHVPITINRTAGESYMFNSQINDFLATNQAVNIIGIDRGEKNLIYYSIIDRNGKLCKSGSLNDVNDIKYAKLLEDRASEREKNRRDWQSAEGIKDLKKGYISQVVRKIADLAVKHNAIVIFEDLNMRFKQIRGGIEKSVYQQLEKALIEKLNYLVFKDEQDPENAGHILKAYQLTNKFETFKKMGKQTGIIFYTQASYTSKVDPVTGWRPNVYLKYNNAKQAKEDILKFSDIVFNASKNRFEFSYDLCKFKKAEDCPKKTKWTLCTGVDRCRWNSKLNNNKGDYEYYPSAGDKSITDLYKKLFIEYDIVFQSGYILDQISALDTNGNENFFKSFIFLFNLICQIRNTNTNKSGNEGDFILSPVEPFFDSRLADKCLPQNGDENGSYNIARKGIILLNRILAFYEKNGSCQRLKWNDLFISHKEWDDFVTNRF